MYFKKLLLIIFFLIAMIVTGIISYMLLEGWGFLDSLYMTIIIITTIGFKEVRTLSGSGRIFTIIFSMVNFVFLAGSIGVIGSAIIDGRVLGVYRRKKMLNKISKLKKHIIVCGAGKIGKHVIKELIRVKEKFVVVEHDIKFINVIQDEYGASLNNLLYIDGNANKEEILIQAGINNAGGLITCMPEDSQNLFISLTARNLNSDLYIASYVVDEIDISKFKLVGVDEVISGDFIIGKKLAKSVTETGMLSFYHQTIVSGKDGYNIKEINIPEGSNIAGKTLLNADILKSTNIVIIAIRKKNNNQFIFNPDSSTVIEEADDLIIMGTDEQQKKLINYTG